MGDQIIRNGETSRSNAAQYDPYTYDPKASEEASKEALPRANFLGGVDTNRPTKLDRLLAIVNNIEKVVEEIKALDPVEVASTEEYVDMGPIAAPEDEE
jgi:hypothetical protein